jgi:hypothetical protein
MKNITVTIHDETYLQARIWAAMHSTSVSALLSQFLESLCDSPTRPSTSRTALWTVPAARPIPTLGADLRFFRALFCQLQPVFEGY